MSSLTRTRAQSIAMIAALRAHLGPIALEIGALCGVAGPAGDRTLLSRRLHPDADPAPLLRWAGWQQVNGHAQILVRPDPAAGHCWLLVDDVPTDTALAFAARRAALVVETSPGNTQLRVRADRPLSVAERTQAQRALCQYLGGDFGSVAGDKWSRLAGFRNVKPGRGGCWTNLRSVELAARPVRAAELLGSAAPLSPAPVGVVGVVSGQGSPAPRSGAGARPQAGASVDNRRSIKHFAFACHALRRGENPDAIITKIAARAVEDGKRPDESSAREYATRTVRAAMDRVLIR